MIGDDDRRTVPCLLPTQARNSRDEYPLRRSPDERDRTDASRIETIILRNFLFAARRPTL
jgi:hypothetical protein